MFEIRQTETYSQWFNTLRDRPAKARIDIRIRRDISLRVWLFNRKWDGVFPLWKNRGRVRAPVAPLFGLKPGQPRGDCPYPVS